MSSHWGYLINHHDVWETDNDVEFLSGTSEKDKSVIAELGKAWQHQEGKAGGFSLEQHTSEWTCSHKTMRRTGHKKAVSTDINQF